MYRIILAALTLINISFAVFPAYAGDVHVKGYYRKDGTYVRPHVRSAPDGIKSNNYGPSQNDYQLIDRKSVV